MEKISIGDKSYSMNEILANEQREIIMELWGQKTDPFNPYLLEKTLGDGLQLVFFGTLDDRPYYWLVRIDSSTNVDDMDSDEIYQLVEEECGGYDNNYTKGNGGCGCCTYCDKCKDDDNYGNYPQIAKSSSPFWGSICNFKTGETTHHLRSFN